MRQWIEVTWLGRQLGPGTDKWSACVFSQSGDAQSPLKIRDPLSLQRDRWDMRSGKNLFDLRNAACLSERQLARRAGVSRAMISRIEIGRIQPSPDVLERIGRAIDVAMIDRFFSR